MEIALAELKTILTEPNHNSIRSVEPKPIGFRIVVIDRGFVHCGHVTDCGDHYLITGAKNIRVWGTTKGLGELVDGPTKDTKLDNVGSVEVQKKAVLFMLLCNREL